MQEQIIHKKYEKQKDDYVYAQKIFDQSEIYLKIIQIMKNTKIVYVLATLDEAKFLMNSEISLLFNTHIANGGKVRLLLHKECKTKKIPKFGNVEVKFGHYRSKSRIIASENGLLMSGFVQRIDDGCVCPTIYPNSIKTVKIMYNMCKNMWRMK